MALANRVRRYSNARSRLIRSDEVITTHAGQVALDVISFNVEAAEDDRIKPKNSAVGLMLQTDKVFFYRPWALVATL